jgi:phage gp36-like protein
MAYATSADFRGRFGDGETLDLVRETLPTSTTLGTDELALVDRQLASATAWLQGYLPQQLVEVPQILIDFCLDVARFKLDFLNERPQVIEAYKSAERYMKLVALGQIVLMDSTQTVVDVDGGPDAIPQSYQRFSDGALAAYIYPNYGGTAY